MKSDHPGAVEQPASTLLGTDCMARCETCQHWLFDEEDWQYESLRFGKCAAIRQRETITEPARDLDDWDAREAEEERLLSLAKAIAVDGSGYYAALRTAPDFGCTLHQPADVPKGQDGPDHSPGMPQNPIEEQR